MIDTQGKDGSVTITVIKAESIEDLAAKERQRPALLRKISAISMRSNKSPNINRQSPKERSSSPIRNNILSSDLMIHPPCNGMFSAELQLKNIIGKDQKEVVVKVSDTRLEILFAEKTKKITIEDEEPNKKVKKPKKKMGRWLTKYLCGPFRKMEKKDSDDDKKPTEPEDEEKSLKVHGHILLPNYIISETLEFSMNYFGNLNIQADIKGAIKSSTVFHRKTFKIDSPLHERLARRMSVHAQNSPVIRNLRRQISCRRDSNEKDPANKRRKISRQASMPARIKKETPSPEKKKQPQRRMTLAKAPSRRSSMKLNVPVNAKDEEINPQVSSKGSCRGTSIAQSPLLRRMSRKLSRRSNVQESKVSIAPAPGGSRQDMSPTQSPLMRRLSRKLSKRKNGEKAKVPTPPSPGEKCRSLAQRLLSRSSPSASPLLGVPRGSPRINARGSSSFAQGSPMLRGLMKRKLLSREFSETASPLVKSRNRIESTAESQFDEDDDVFGHSGSLPSSPYLSSRMYKGTATRQGVFRPWVSVKVKGKKKKKVNNSCTWELMAGALDAALQAASLDSQINMTQDGLVYRQSVSMD